MAKSFRSLFCMRRHRLRDGKPVDHECLILPPRALRAEQSGDLWTAMALIQGEARVRHAGIASLRPLEEKRTKLLSVIDLVEGTQDLGNRS